MANNCLIVDQQTPISAKGVDVIAQGNVSSEKSGVYTVIPKSGGSLLLEA